MNPLLAPSAPNNTITEDAGAPLYPKIPGPFKRQTDRTAPNYNQVIHGEWSDPAIEYLSGLAWWWTEKIDGTNVRVHWDGVGVTFAGRTNKAQLPPRLEEALESLFTEELFEEHFQGTAVTLYGEGYGGKIQKGGNYRPDESFMLFDVRIGKWWLQRADVVDVGVKFGIDSVPIVMIGNIWEAIDRVEGGMLSHVAPTNFQAEGLVGVPYYPVLDRSGHRVIVKVKSADFFVGDK